MKRCGRKKITLCQWGYTGKNCKFAKILLSMVVQRKDNVKLNLKIEKKFSLKKSFSQKTIPKILSMGVHKEDMEK